MSVEFETLEDNKVKLHVEVDDTDWNKAVDDAFRRIAKEVRLPGFRPGKAPRQLIEQRIGVGAAREEALREALPDFYARAIKEADLDPIAPPDIEITSGRDEGPLVFDATVEVRPVISIAGYKGLEVEVPSLEVSEEEVEKQLERFRSGFADLQVVDRAAQDGDNVVIDIATTTDGVEVEQLSQDDYTYEVGSGIVLPELDDQIRGAKAGDQLSFDAEAPGEVKLHLEVSVKEVKEKLLPELTDEWVNENSEFDNVDALTNDIRERVGTLKKLQSQAALRDNTMRALVELVIDDVPQAMINSEVDASIRDLAQRLAATGVSVPDWLERTGQTQEDLISNFKERAMETAKSDLALRALADAEGIEANDEELDAHINLVAEQMGQKGPALRRQLEKADQMSVVELDVRKQKAYDWLVENVAIVDAETRKPIERAALDLDRGDDEGGESASAEASSEGGDE